MANNTLIDSLMECLHQPNRKKPYLWHVKPNHVDKFSEIITAMGDASARKDEGSIGTTANHDSANSEPTSPITDTLNDWLIISWQHIDHQDAAYGKVLSRFRGTEEEAKAEARLFIPDYKPVGIVREIV